MFWTIVAAILFVFVGLPIIFRISLYLLDHILFRSNNIVENDSDSSIKIDVNESAIEKIEFIKLSKNISLKNPKNGQIILLIGFELDLTKLLSSIFQKESYVIEVVRDGFEGLHKLSERPYDLVITNIIMPEIDGLEMMRVANNDTDNYHKQKFVVMSSLEGESIIKDSLESGAVEFWNISRTDQNDLIKNTKRILKNI